MLAGGCNFAQLTAWEIIFRSCGPTNCALFCWKIHTTCVCK